LGKDRREEKKSLDRGEACRGDTDLIDGSYRSEKKKKGKGYYDEPILDRKRWGGCWARGKEQTSKKRIKLTKSAPEHVAATGMKTKVTDKKGDGGKKGKGCRCRKTILYKCGGMNSEKNFGRLAMKHAPPTN